MSVLTLSEPGTIDRRSVSVETLGCKVNLFESEYILDQLKSRYRVPVSGKAADLCIVNTCTVTREADRQSRQAIRRTIRNNPDATVIVTGCYAQMQPDECAGIPGVDYVIPGDKKLQIPQLIAGEVKIEALLTDSSNKSASEFPEKIITGFESRTRANLQVQQGCDNGCTFCIIHTARGPSRSISPTTVIRQVEQYVRQGFAEIVICGIDLGSYGEDLANRDYRTINLAALTSELAARYPDTRFRLSSIDPVHITPDLVDAFRKHDNICPHIHLSLQSASPIILKRMKRRYQPEDVFDAVAALRSTRSDLILSADIMAGFPTESDADFELTRKAIFDLQIAYPHVFAYSERDQTPAAKIPKQVPPVIRKARAKSLREAGDTVRKQVLDGYIGRIETGLTEGRVSVSDNLFRSRLANYLPVYFACSNDLSGQSVKLRLTGTCRDGLQGILNSR